MEETLSSLIEMIQYWLVYGLLPYSLVFYLLKLKRSNSPDLLDEFDNLVCRIVIISGRIIACLVLAHYLFFVDGRTSDEYLVGDQMIYTMSMRHFIQILLVLLATQLLIHPFLRMESWYRVLVGLIGYFVTEYFIMVYAGGGSKILINTWDWDSGVEALFILLLPGLALVAITALVFFGKRLRTEKNLEIPETRKNAQG